MGREESKELGISHPDSKALHATRDGFIFLRVVVADVYSNNAAKSTAFHATSFYQYSKYLLQRLYNVHVYFSEELKPSFVASRTKSKPRLWTRRDRSSGFT